MHELIIDTDAAKEFAKLPETVKRRILSKLLMAKDEPHRYFSRLVGRDDYRLRVGDYRVIADLEPTRIVVTAVKHRREAYLS